MANRILVIDDEKSLQILYSHELAREGYDVETAARRTIAFAQAMREVDPTIELIGWGDSGWASKMLEMAGEHLQ